MRSAAILLIEIALLAMLFSYLASRQHTERAITAPPTQDRLTGRLATGTRLPSEKKRLKDAQDGYLEILVTAPEDRNALRGLMLVRRQLAGDDPAILREQAATYRQAIAKGVEIADEHYTSEAMAILADASMRAASEIVRGSTSPSAVVLATGPATLARTIGLATLPRRPGIAPQRALQAAPDTRSLGSVEPPAHRTWRHQAVTSPDLEERRGPRYRIEVGPVFSLEHATAVAGILKQAGYAPRLSKSIEPGHTDFQVISEVLPRRVGETRATALADLGFRVQIRRVSNDRLQLHFGTLASRGNALELARRIRATGYWAAVAGGSAAGYLIVLGPHGQPTVDAITGIFMARSRITSPVTVIPAQ